MDNNIKPLKESHLDIFHAIKRALMRRGVPSVSKTTIQSRVQSYKKSHQSNVSSDLTVTNEVIPTSGYAEVEQEPHTPTDDDKKASEGPEQLMELDERAHDVLFKADTVFPFTPFPHTITLDREKLTICERMFWRVAKITSVPVSEILSCQLTVGPLFGSIHLVFSFFADNQKTITYLWRDDATKFHQILHGYIVAHKRGVNTTNVSVEDLKILLKDLGQGVSD